MATPDTPFSFEERVRMAAWVSLIVQRRASLETRPDAVTWIPEGLPVSDESAAWYRIVMNLRERAQSEPAPTTPPRRRWWHLRKRGKS